MENLEQICLEKLNKILSKFDLKIDIIHLAPFNGCQYCLVDNILDKKVWKTEWLGSWLSLNDLLFNKPSIFECLELYHIVVNDFNFLSHATYNVSSMYQRYSKIYKSIQLLKSCCPEEFIIKCDLMNA